MIVYGEWDVMPQAASELSHRIGSEISAPTDASGFINNTTTFNRE